MSGKKKLTVLLPPSHGHYIGQSVISRHPQLRTRGFFGKFYCPHALADGN